MTGQRKAGVKGAAMLLDRSFLSYLVLPTAKTGGRACCRLRTDPFWDGIMMGRKWLPVEDAGIER